MIEDFLLPAFLAGIGIVLLTAPLGCFVVWRRLSYYGETVSHSALIGVAISLFFTVDVTYGIFAIVLLVSVFVILIQKVSKLSGDTVLGILSHVFLALGILFVTKGLRVDLMGYLFGDILAVNETDLYIVFGLVPVVYAVLYRIKEGLIADTISTELSTAEKMNPDFVKYVFSVLLAVTISVSIKIVGILMVMSLLIIPSATSSRYSLSPESSVLLSMLFGLVAVVLGIYLSVVFDSATGPTIVVTAGTMFFLSLLTKGRN